MKTIHSSSGDLLHIPIVHGSSESDATSMHDSASDSNHSSESSASSSDERSVHDEKRETSAIDDLAIKDLTLCISGDSPTAKDCDEGDEGDDDDLDEEDNGRYRLIVNEARPKKISQRRQEDQAIWESFCQRNSETIVKENSERLVRSQKQFLGGGRSNTGTATSSVLFKDILNANPAPKRIIHSAREYQIALFERCKMRNTIVVLDTGTGKTLIAAMMLRYTLEQELENRRAGKQKRTAFFLVDKVALVNQQHNFLQNNLDFTVAQYCGETSERIWNTKSWHEICEKNMVIVCTAAILHKALGHSFIRISEINLIIFDEAHHAKKDHMYARIIKDFYIRERDRSARPRIMGMTASPVDGKEEIAWAAERLETCLNSEIATVSFDMLQRGLDATGQQELVNYYNPLVPTDPTALHRTIEQKVGDFTDFKRMFSFAKRAATELGPWLADRFWHMCLSGDALTILAARCERDVSRTYHRSRGLEDPSSSVLGLRSVLASQTQPPVARTNEHLSTKVLHLLDLLERSFTKDGVGRAIVFVEQRYTAMLLHDLLQQPEIQIPGVIPSVLMGGTVSGEVMPTNSSMLAQRITIIKFRNGDYTCLFATSVAEEGIDIPQCDLVVRFDLYNSMIQYVQSKGRARHKLSTYINMAEFGQREHDRKIKEAQHAALRLRRFCATVNRERRVDLDEDDEDAVDSVLQGELHYKHHYIPETGARMTFLQSLELLAAFVSSLEHEHDTSLAPEYLVTPHGGGGGYICQVLLPEMSPIRSALGQPQLSKKAAKCSAAFEICRQLIDKGYIDSHLQPIFRKRLPAMRNARLAVSSNKRAEYKMTIKPRLWSQLGRPEVLYGAALVLDSPAAAGRASTPLMLLTRSVLPDLPGFSLFFAKDQESLVRVVSLPFQEPLRPTDKDLDQLVAYTLRVFEDVFSKKFEASAAELPYFVVPSSLVHGHRYDTDGVKRDLRDMIRWTDCDAVQASEYVAWDRDTIDAFFEDRLVIDQYDGSRKFFTRRVDHSMTPHSELPEWLVAPKFRAWNKLSRKTPMEYSNSVWDRYRYHKQWSSDQRVVESELIPLRRNLLDENQEDRPNPTCWLVLEPLRISTLRADAVSMLLAFPTLIYRIESHLIALEACEKLDLAITPGLALEAITKDSDNTDEHGEEQVNFQAGMGSNYERLEFLGDTFLKMATTISLFTQAPTANEFEYHVERMVMICNKNLFNTAVDKNIQEYIRSCQFDRNTWYPQGLKLIKGKKVGVRTKHPLGDKTIADVCEALIGAAYLSGIEGEGPAAQAVKTAGHGAAGHGFDMAVKAVTALVRNQKHKQLAFADYYPSYKVPEWQKGPYSAAQEELQRQLAESTGYVFASPSLARSAFKHPSYPYETAVPHYQRLEFLGDSLLDMVCVEFLFKRYPGANPQWLTEHKMAMVSNQFLGCLGVKLGFHRHILATSSALLGQIREYASELEMVRQEAETKAREEQEGTERIANRTTNGYWLHAAEPPKALSDVVEAFLGAIFVDSRYDFSRVQFFFDTHVRPFFQDMALYDSFAKKHPVTALARILAQDMGCARWRLMIHEVAPTEEEAGLGAIIETRVMCGVLVHGQVLETAVSASGRYAKVGAAKKALGVIQNMDREAFREKFACDCTGEDVAAGGDHGTPV